LQLKQFLYDVSKPRQAENIGDPPFPVHLFHVDISNNLYELKATASISTVKLQLKKLAAPSRRMRRTYVKIRANGTPKGALI